MNNQLWNLFRETGDPMGYLLYRADGKEKTAPPRKPENGNTKKPRTDDSSLSV